MSTTDEQIQELIEEAGGLESGPVRLAQVVSMAARVDWALLRRARVELLPAVDPSAEADLWASLLVHTRGPDGFVLHAEVAAWLQAKLAAEDDEQTRLKEAGELMLCEHEHLPPTFRLEERLTYWGLSKNHSEATLKRELGQVVRALRDPNRRALTVWVEQALDRLPDRVRQLDPALVLRDAVVSWSDVGGHAVRDVPAGVGRDIWATLFTTKSDARLPFLLRLAGDVLEIAPKTHDAPPQTSSPPSVEIQVPDTDPLFIEARWVEGDEHRIIHVFPRAAEAVRLRVGTDLELRFVDGMGLSVHSGDTSAGLVNIEVVRLLEDLPNSVVEKAAKQLGIEPVQSAPLRTLLSGAMVRYIPEEGLSVLNAVLEVLEDFLKPGDAMRLFDLLTPLWVDPSAAQQVQEAASRPLGSRGVFLNCTTPLTAELYVRRAWLGMEPPVVVTIDSTTGSSHPVEALQQVANALSQHLRVRPSKLSEVLSDYERPIFLLLNLVSLSVDAILAIARQWTVVTLFLYGQPELLTPERLPVNFITYIAPALAPDAERTFITTYREARSRWERAEERKARRSDARREEQPTWSGKFDNHVYISYHLLDDQPLPPEQQGWITRFHASLEAFLSMRLGRKTEIWRDQKLTRNDVFTDEIIGLIRRTAVFIAVISPRYLKSEWCIREVQEFCNSAQQSGGVVVDNRARVFKVIKMPVDTEESLPPVMRDVLGYEFFTYEEGAPLELDPVANPQAYKLKVNKLAWDIVQLLKKLEARTDVNATGVNAIGRNAPATAKPAIYLAECSRDRREAREILEGDLRRYGYTVLPDQPLPRDEEDYVAAVERLLARCTLSIHLVGEIYGAVPDGPSQKSVTVLQNELAVQQSKSGKLSRLIWLREGTTSTQVQQQAFIETLHQDAEAQFGADLITGDLEELKTSIHARLSKLETPEYETPPASETARDRPKLIYLICDRKDRRATVPVQEFCREHGFEVQIPVFEGDATELREANQQLLTTCDAVILFYGAGDEAWKRTVDNELKKMSGYRGGKPLLANYTYLADPKTSDKEDLIDMEEPNLINGLEGFSVAEMAALMQTMNP